jgi:hypothetical protein
MRILPVRDYVVLYRVEENDVLIQLVRGSRDLEAVRRE